MPQTIVIFGTVGALLVATVMQAEAKHRPQSHCSKSGDVCDSARRIDGTRRLRITLSANYFRSFELYVDPPGDAPPACEQFRVRKMKDGFCRSVRRARTSPTGAGAYTVTWRVRGSRIGARLGFHV